MHIPIRRNMQRCLTAYESISNKYLRQNTTPQYRRTQPRISILDPYKPYLLERVNATHPEWIPAVVLYKEILGFGYPGKIRILREYLATLKPVAKSEPVIRLDR